MKKRTYTKPHARAGVHTYTHTYTHHHHHHHYHHHNNNSITPQHILSETNLFFVFTVIVYTIITLTKETTQDKTDIMIADTFVFNTNLNSSVSEDYTPRK